jgi:hypothetical protein
MIETILSEKKRKYELYTILNPVEDNGLIIWNNSIALPGGPKLQEYGSQKYEKGIDIVLLDFLRESVISLEKNLYHYTQYIEKITKQNEQAGEEKEKLVKLEQNIVDYLYNLIEKRVDESKI